MSFSRHSDAIERRLASMERGVSGAKKRRRGGPVLKLSNKVHPILLPPLPLLRRLSDSCLSLSLTVEEAKIFPTFYQFVIMQKSFVLYFSPNCGSIRALFFSARAILISLCLPKGVSLFQFPNISAREVVCPTARARFLSKQQNNKTLTAVSSSRGGRTSSCQAVTAREEAKHWQVVHRIDKARAQLNSHTLLFVWIA